MAEFPPTLMTPRSIFARRRHRQSRGASDNISISSCWSSRQQEAAREMGDNELAAQETVSACTPRANAPQYVDNESISKADNFNGKNHKTCDAPSHIERETTADSEVSVQSLTGSSAAETTQEAQAAAAAAATTIGAAGQHMRRLLLAAKRFLFPSQLHGWLLLLVLLQQVLLIGMLLQQRQLVEQREVLEQRALSMQHTYNEQQRRLLNSRRSRLGYKPQPQPQQQKKQYCSCKACAVMPPSEELIDIRDRFKHTYKDIELRIQEMLTSLDTAATAVEETYKETMSLPWKSHFDDKLRTMRKQDLL